MFACELNQFLITSTFDCFNLPFFKNLLVEPLKYLLQLPMSDAFLMSALWLNFVAVEVDAVFSYITLVYFRFLWFYLKYAKGSQSLQVQINERCLAEQDKTTWNF